MWTRALLKENAKIAFKRNYWTCVIVSVILMLIGAGVEGPSFNFSAAANGASGSNTSMNGGYGTEIFMNFTGRHVILMSLIGIFAIVAAIIAILFSIFVTNVIAIGGKRYFMENREHKTLVGQLFHAFQSGNYMNCVKTMFFRDLYIFGWTLLFIIPGIIKSFSYQLVPYILAENPNISKDRAIELSSEMMDGYKMESFVLGWSFILWDFAVAFTAGLAGIFYVKDRKSVV